MAHVGGVPREGYCRQRGRCDFAAERARIERDVRETAYHIIDYRGATFFGIGMSLVRITGAILRNENSVLTVSVLLEGEYGIRDVCLSVPCLLNGSGAERIIVAGLTVEEGRALEHSAETLKAARLGLGAGASA